MMQSTLAFSDKSMNVLHTLQPTDLSNSTPIVSTEQSENVFMLYDATSLTILASVVGILAVFGIVANGVTIYVIYHAAILHTVFNHFILSLSISDLLSAIVSPLFLYKNSIGYRNWMLPRFFCKVFWSVDMGTSVLTSLHVMTFSALRFASLKWPYSFKKFTLKQAKGAILFLWVVSIGGGFLPFAFWVDVKERFPIPSPACGVADLKSFQQYRVYAVVGYSIFFFIPCILIFTFSCGVSSLIVLIRLKRVRKFQGKALNQSEEIRQRKENQAILQLLLIVGSYLFGYIPTCAYHIYMMLGERDSDNMLKKWWLGIVVHLMLRLSECLNPVFYNLASSQTRGETMKCFKRNCERLGKDRCLNRPAVNLA